MNDIEPVRNFLKEVQGNPDLIYTQAVAKAYQQQLERVQQLMQENKQQAGLQKQLLKKLAHLQELIRDYDQEIQEATQFLGDVSESEIKHLRAALSRIRKTELEVQDLFSQLG